MAVLSSKSPVRKPKMASLSKPMNHMHVAKGAAHAWTIMVGSLFAFLFMASLATAALAQQDRDPAANVFAQLTAEVRALSKRVSNLEKSVNMLTTQCADNGNCVVPTPAKKETLDRQNACGVNCTDAKTLCVKNAKEQASVVEFCKQDALGCLKACAK